MLFDELDDDHDGQVSFEEFLHGLFIAKDKSQSESDPPSHSVAIENQPEVIIDELPLYITFLLTCFT